MKLPGVLFPGLSGKRKHLHGSAGHSDPFQVWI